MSSAMAEALLSSPPSALQPHPAPADTTPSTEQLVHTTLAQSAHDLLLPTPSLHTALRLLAKRYLDPLAASVSQVQQQRLQNEPKKRKRGAKDEEAPSALRLKRVHLDGFSTDQVWEQARIVLAAATAEVERGLEELRLQQHAEGDRDGMQELSGPAKKVKKTRFADGEPDSGLDRVNGVEEASESSDAGMLDGEVDGEVDGELNGDLEDEDIDDEDIDDEILEDGITDEEDLEQDGEDIEVESDPDQGTGRQRTSKDTFAKDKHGLNDGFFSIDDFNNNTDFLERQDARGDPDDGAASDEEDVDYSIDPMSQPTPIGTANPRETEDSPSSDDEETGPTFGNADLSAPFDSDDDDVDMDDPFATADDDDTHANDIRYADFFAPPPRPASAKRGRPLPKTQPSPALDEPEPSPNDVARTMASVRRDIFGSPSPAPQPTGAPASNNLSTHERRRAALAAEIRALEAAAVAPREWLLAGEARAADRPRDALLDAELDFERAGKPAPPPTTADDTRAFEDLVKARIRERRFDEVRVRRPDPRDLGGGGGDAAAARRGRTEDVDLAAGAPGSARRGLAEEYAEAHTGAAAAARDAATERARDEVRARWAEVAGRLDRLCGWQARPAPAAVRVAVVSDAPRVALEEARPGVAEALGAGEAGGLAPQEVYRVGEGADQAEAREMVVTKGGAVVAREEMTRDERRRRRRRAKERLRKRGEGAPETEKAPAETAKEKPPDRKAKKDRERTQIVEQLKSAGVKVIGRDGEIRDVEGNKAALRDRKVRSKSGGGYKL